MKRTAEENRKDPANWKLGVIYYCEDDPRVIVSKRFRWSGYTVNFAHSHALLVLLAMIAAILAPFSLAWLLEPPILFVAIGVTFAAVMTVLIVICHREASDEQ
jgi:Family of unknown function (DUF5808)